PGSICLTEPLATTCSGSFRRLESPPGRAFLPSSPQPAIQHLDPVGHRTGHLTDAAQVVRRPISRQVQSPRGLGRRPPWKLETNNRLSQPSGRFNREPSHQAPNLLTRRQKEDSINGGSSACSTTSTAIWKAT